MHDPEFEKKVQQKMEELAFSPSEAVWTNLERQINTNKRRRMPLFWLFFLSGLLLAGGAGAYLIFGPAASLSGHRNAPVAPIARTSMSETHASTPPASSNSATPAPASGVSTPTVSAPAASKPTASTSTTSASAAPTPVIPVSPKTISATPTQAIAHSTASIPAWTGSSHSLNTVPVLVSSGNTARTHHAERRSYPSATVHQAGTPLTGSRNSPSGALHSETLTLHSGAQLSDALTPHSDALTPAVLSLSPTGSIVSLGQGISDPSSARTAIKTGSLPAAKFLPVPANATAAKKKNLDRPSLWEAGFAGGGGLSSEGRQPFQTKAPVTYYSSSPALALALLAPTAQTPNSLSSIQPDFSFWTGIFAQRPVLKRLSFSAGLNLHYYSTTLETGKQVSGPAAAASVVTASLFYSSAVVAPAQSYPYYPAGNGNIFTNRYYFLEIPVSLQWQLNKGKKLPLFWEAGLSFSRLMSENALYYNNSAGLYYKDGGEGADPSQINASMAFMIGLRTGRSRIQLGPQIQYGLTSLVNDKLLGAQHLFYGGLKITLVPGRK